MAGKPDAVLFAAVDLAREAAVGIAEPDTVGDHEGAVMDAERLATHYFTCTAAAYPGWRWAVTVARAPRSKKATVCEANLVPGEGALLSPEWLPYDQRLRPGDIGAGDVLPYIEEDQRLVPGFEATGEEDVDEAAQWELGLGRKRVLSSEGREAAAQRWYDGEHGPTHAGRRAGPGAVLHVRVLRADGWCTPLFFRRLRQRLVALRRSRREP